VWEIKQGDALSVLKTMPEQSVHCCVTSPPYFGLRDYGVEGQIGLERTPEEYVDKLVQVFREVRRVLRDDGTLWLNLGDSYSGSCQTGGVNSISGKGKSQPHVKHKRNTNLKPKDLIGIPWMVAFALRADGWYLRSDIIWHKPNALPESVTDRPTKAHEYIFLLTKNLKYYYDAEAIKEPIAASTVERAKSKNNASTRKDKGAAQLQSGLTPEQQDKWYSNIDENTVRNKRSVWTVTTKPFKGAHFAVFPPDLIEPCILAGCPVGGTVLDPFAGSGTTLLVATQHNRKSIGIELNPEYIEIAKRRLNSVQLKLVME
jgi:DNA modification methylase